MPPNGAVRSRTRNVLTHTVPARIARPTRSARPSELRVDDARQPVLGRVGERDRLLLGRERLQGEHRPEDLALDDLGVVGRAARSASARRAARRRGAPPRTIVSPVRPRALDEALDAREVVGVDQRRDRRRVVARVAEDVRVDGGVEALQELVADRRPRRAAACRRGRPGRRRRTGPRPCVAAASRSASAKTIERALAAELGRERHEVRAPRRRRSGGRSRASR